MAWTDAGQGGGGPRGRKRPAAPPVCPLSALELEREKNLRENEAFLRSLGIDTIRDDMRGAAAAPQQQQPVGGGSKGEVGIAGKRSRITLAEVRSKWSGRGDQIDQLAKLLPPPSQHEVLPPVLLCYGPRGTGKTGVLRDVLQALEHPHALIRGREHGSSRSLYGTIIKEWLRHAEETDQGEEGLEDVKALDAMDRVDDEEEDDDDDDDEDKGGDSDEEDEEKENGGGGE